MPVEFGLAGTFYETALRGVRVIFGDSIRLAREVRGLEVGELAEKVCRSEAEVSAWEGGAVQPEAADLYRLSFALQFPPRFFQEEHEHLSEWNTLDAHSYTYTCDGCDEPIDGPHDHIYAGEKDYHPWCQPTKKR